MSELSTADLAGRNTPRTETRDTSLDGQPTGGEALDNQPSTSTNTAAPMAGSTIHAAPPPHERLDEGANNAEPLFPTADAQTFRGRWTEVQTGFVDEPRHAVEQADGLVAEMMKQLAEVFADERSKLEEQWSRGDDISTEDLRQALRRYRSFFDRLLSV
jgi:hypothetical protein